MRLLTTLEIREEKVLVSKDVLVNNETGLHARPAALFVQRANEFESEISIELDDNKANAKSIIGVMSLGVYGGETVTLTAEGKDSEEAIEDLKVLLEEEMIEE